MLILIPKAYLLIIIFGHTKTSFLGLFIKGLFSSLHQKQIIKFHLLSSQIRLTAIFAAVGFAFALFGVFGSGLFVMASSFAFVICGRWFRRFLSQYRTDLFIDLCKIKVKLEHLIILLISGFIHYSVIEVICIYVFIYYAEFLANICIYFRWKHIIHKIPQNEHFIHQNDIGLPVGHIFVIGQGPLQVIIGHGSPELPHSSRIEIDFPGPDEVTSFEDFAGGQLVWIIFVEQLGSHCEYFV